MSFIDITRFRFRTRRKRSCRPTPVEFGWLARRTYDSGFRFWTEADTHKLEQYYMSRPVYSGSWILINRKLVFSWFPARVIECTIGYKPFKVFYYGDTPPRNVAAVGDHHEVKDPGEYWFSELMIAKSARYAVLPRWMDLSNIHTIIGHRFSGWTTLRLALMDLSVICDPNKWWRRKSSLPNDQIRRVRITQREINNASRTKA